MQTAWLNLPCRVWLLLALMAGGVFAGDVHATGRTDVLRAIQAVENPHGSSRPGKYGELGPYQFRPGTWRMHTKVPFDRALSREAAETVAIRHYEWIKRGLVRNGVAASPYNIALAWNGGLSAVVRGRASAASHDYADRVNNLAREISATRVARLE